MLSIFNRWRVTNNMQIQSEIVSKFSIACKNIRFSSLFAAGTFRMEERLRLSHRNSILMT